MGLNRPSLLLALEPRMMFDGAGVATADAVVDAVPQDSRISSPTNSAKETRETEQPSPVPSPASQRESDSATEPTPAPAGAPSTGDNAVASIESEQEAVGIGDGHDATSDDLDATRDDRDQDSKAPPGDEGPDDNSLEQNDGSNDTAAVTGGDDSDPEPTETRSESQSDRDGQPTQGHFAPHAQAADPVVEPGPSAEPASADQAADVAPTLPAKGDINVREVVFIDTGTADYELLLTDLIGDASTDRTTIELNALLSSSPGASGGDLSAGPGDGPSDPIPELDDHAATPVQTSRTATAAPDNRDAAVWRVGEVQVVLLDSERDGIAQISEALDGLQDIAGVHIVSHGATGAVKLGNTWLNRDNVEQYAAQIAAWSDAFETGGDLLFYGCDLAVNTDGRMLIQNLSHLTGTDVAASVDDTGHTAQGGDWDLEYRVGSIEEGVVFSTAAQANWQQLLNLSLLVTTDNDVSGSGAPGLNSWTRGEVLEFDDPNLTFDPSGSPANTTDGTFSSMMNLDSLVQDGDASVDALHYVSSAIRVGDPGGGPDSFDLQIGDLLMSTEQSETLVGTNGNLSVGDDDAFVFRPTTTGDYSDGAFYMLLDGAQISGITNIDGLTLVEQTVTVGSGSTLNAGTFLVSEGNSVFDIRHFTADGVGAGSNTQGTLSTLIDGSDINFDSFVRGIELAETELTIAGTTIPEGSILATFSQDDSSVGDNSIDTDQQDIFYITVSQTEWDQSTTVANATLLFDGIDVALDTTDEDIWGFTFLSSPTTNTLVVDTTFDGLPDGNTSSIDNLIANKGADGKISLREALEATNNTPNGATPDQIQFNISTSDSGYEDPDGIPGNGDEYWSIAVDPAGLTTLSDPVVVDATTQPGYSGNPVIELDGSATPAASGINGIRVQTNDSVVKGFVVHSFADEGIEIDGSSGFGDNNVIQNNWVGVDAEGSVAANAEFQLMVSDDSDGNQIGGSGANEGNVIVAAPSGFSGVIIRRHSDDTIVEGNYIGVLPDGTTAAGNSEHGILIQFSADNTRIGGTDPGAGNVISGNALDGIHIDGATDATYTTVVDGTLVQGNYIGTNSAGTAALGNGDDGVSVQNGATDTVIGGDTAAERNIISGNLGAGVYVTSTTTTGTLIQGNYIGTDINGTADLGNGGVGADSGVRFWNAGATTVGGVNSGEGNIIAYSGRFGVEVGGSSSGISILGNTIFSNDGIGIDLDGGIEDVNLVTDNDVGDGDGGANNLQNYPALTSAVTDGSSTITIDGTLDTDGTSQDYRIEFFANTTADGSGHGEGQRYLGFTTVTTNGSGDASFSAAIAATVAVNEHITATATVDNGGSYGDTSEFGQNILSTNDPPALDLDADDSSGETGADFAATFTEDGGPVAVADADATLSDVDDTNLESLTVTITNLLDGADEVLAAVTAGTSITASYMPGTGVLTLTGTDTKANYRQVLRSVTYNNTSQSPNTTARVVTFVANDGINDSNTGTTTVTVVSQNDPPVVTTSGGNTGYTEQAAAVVIDAGVTLADPDGFDGTDPSDQYVGVIQITGNYDSNDILGFVDTANIQGNRVGDTLTLTVRGGQTATVAEFETALQSVTFFNGDDDPSALNRTVSFSFDDGIDNSGIATKTVAVTPVNDAPTVSLANTTTTLPEDADTSSRVKVADIVVSDDSQGTNTLSLAGADAALFEIVGTELFIQAGTTLDFETNPSLDVTVEVDDTAVGSTPDDTAALAISITDVNDPPMVSLFNTIVSLPEDMDTSSRIKVADIVVSDDALGTNTLSLSGSDASLFEIIGTELFIQAGTTLDYETNPVLDVIVEIDDTAVGSTPDDTAALSISVTDDISSPASILTDEDTAFVFSGANVIEIRDTVADSTQVRMSLDVGNGTLTLAGTTGITFLQGSDGSANMVIQGTKSNVNNALDGLSFDPTQDYNGPDTLDMELYVGADLISAYAFEGGSGTDSVSGNDGTVNGATTVAGPDGDALSFDEVNDHVLVPDFAISNEFTISFNMKVDDNSGTLFQYLYSHGDVNSTNSVNVFLTENAHGTDPNVLRTVVRDTNDSLDNTALDFDISGLVGDGQWHTYTLTVESGTGSRVYLDGVLQNSDSRGGDSFDPAMDLYLGARQDLDANRFYGGGLDNVQIYDSALSSGEVSDLHDVGSAVASVAITVDPANDAPTVSLSNTTTSLAEDADTSSRVKVGDILVSDVDGGTNTLSLSGSDASLFEIIGTELFIQAGTTLDFETNPTLDVTVEVDDTTVGSTPDDTAALAITITDVNEPPSVSLANTTTTLPEDTDTSSRVKVADIAVADDALGTNTLALSGTDAALFEIIGTELFIQAGTTLDFETNPTLDVTVEVDDTAVGSTPDDTAALAISITDANEPPSVSLANTTTSLSEDTDTSSRVKVADIVVTDDALGTNTLSLSGADAALFEIVGTELFIQAGTALDFETNPTLDVTVEVDDTAVGATPDDTAALAISVTDVNEPPSVSLANTTTTLPEDTDTSSRIKVADIVVSDDALGTNTLALSGADAALFEIIGTELFIQAGSALDFETNPTLDVTVEVDDTAVGATPDDTAALAISITDVNEPPSVSLANTTTTLPENTDTSSRVKVADIVITDDALGTNTLALSGTDAALFEIIGTELFIQAGTTLDFETNPTLDITVEVDDTAVGSTPDDTAALAISVTDVNEPPSVSLANTTTTLTEDTDTSSRIKVADIVVSDDAIGTNTLGLSGADAALFEIIGTELFIQAGTALDFETNPTLDVTVEVDDTAVGSTPDDSAPLAIAITDVNEPPTVSLANTTTSLPEDTDTSSRVKVADIVITDDALGTNTLALSGADAALFEIIGSEVFIQAGTALDFETNPSLNVTVEVDDTAVGSTPDDTAALAISITDVNEPPSVSLANTTTTLPEDTDTSSRVKVADIVVTDDALGTNTLALSGADAALFEIIGTELFIQAGTTLDFETNASLDVTVEVDDTAVGSTPDDTAALAISITDVNEPPTVSLANTTTTLPEDTDTSSRVKVADIVVTDDALGTNTLALSGTDAALFEIIGTELFIQASTTLDFETNPTLDVTVEVDDTAVGSTPDDTAALAITITDVNEPPSVSLANTTTALPEDTDTSSRVKVADIVITDDALGTNTLSLSGADAALFEIIGTELFIQAGTALDFETNPTLDVTLEIDDTSVGATPDDTAALAITITDENDPPTVSLANTTNTLPEDTDTSSRIKVADIVVTDDAQGTNTLSLSGADAALFEIIGAELFIQAGTTLDFETNPSLDVTVEVDDTAVGSTPDDTAALAISVTDVNEPPSVSLANATTTLPEDTDTSSRVKVADIVVTDDALGANTLSLSGTDAALFEIIGTELFTQAGTTLDFETNPTLDVTVEVDDTAVGSTPDDTAGLAISITDANEPPSVSLTNTTNTLSEDTDTSSRVKVADIVVTDDALGTNTLSLSGADAALFEIVGTELFIQAGAALDFETNPTLDVTVEVDDTAVGSTPDDTSGLAITITDVNEPPSVSLANTTTTLPEDTDTSSRVKVADIVVTDDALGTNTLALTGADAALFEIIGTELFIQAGAALDFETKPTLDVTVEVDDTGVGSTPDDTAGLAITITDVNEPPSVSLANTTTTLPEDTDTSSRVKVADIVVTDDALGTNTLSLSGADAALFEIIGTELFIQAGTTLDFETNPTLDVTVEVDDTAVGSTPDDAAAMAITITDVNEPPSVSLANTTTTLPEDTDTSSRVKVADIVVTDDALGTNTLALSGADAALFEIVGTELFIQAGTALDFETNPTLDVTVEVDDTAVGSTPDDTAALAISITDVNEPPSVSLANTTTTLPEDTDTSSRVKVADIVVTDDALGTNTLSLSGTDAALFEIIGTELFIQAGTALDFETNPTLDITVEVDDTAIGSTPDDDAALAITITDVNEPPSVALANTTTTLPEDTDTSSRLKVADIVVTDDALGTNTLALSGADAALFEIIGTELFIQAGTTLDFETNPTLDVTVEVDDTAVGSTPDDTTALAITITDVNEPPSVSLANTTTTFPEDTDTSSRVKVADIVITDDALGTNTLALSGADAALFEIIGTELFIQAGTTLDFETNPTLDVTVEVDDTAVGSAPDDAAALAITITDVNEPPTVTLANVVSSLAENTDTTSRVKIADIVVSDDALGTNTLFLTGADAAVFEIVGNELFLRAGTNFDFESDPSLEVTVNVDDSTLAPTPDDNLVLTVDITRVNTTSTVPDPDADDPEPQPDPDPESDPDKPVTTEPDGPGPDMTPTDRIDYPDGGNPLDPSEGTDRSQTTDAEETVTHFNHPSDLAEGGPATRPAEFRVRGFAEGLVFKPYIVKSQLPTLDPNALPVLSLSNLAMPPISTLQIPVALFDMLDQLKVDIERNHKAQSAETFSTLTVAISSTVALSVGYVAWLLRFGALAAAVASITPLWREFDPLPILSKRATPKTDPTQHDQSRDEARVDRLFDESSELR